MSGHPTRPVRIVGDSGPAPERTARRLSDKIEQAFDQACEQGLTEVAGCMLKGLDLALLGRPQGWERRQAALGVLRACHARLEEMRRQERASATAGVTGEGFQAASAA